MNEALKALVRDMIRETLVLRRAEILHFDNGQASRLRQIIEDEGHIRQLVREELAAAFQNFEWGAILTRCATEAAEKAFAEGYQSHVMSDFEPVVRKILARMISQEARQ